MELPIIEDIEETSSHYGGIGFTAKDGGNCVLVGGVNAENATCLEEIFVDEEMSGAAK